MFGSAVWSFIAFLSHTLWPLHVLLHIFLVRKKSDQHKHNHSLYIILILKTIPLEASFLILSFGASRLMGERP